MENKNKKIIKITALILVLVIFLGVSYALFSEVLVGTKKYNVSSGNLQILLDESNTSESISLDGQVPVTDDTGMEYEKYKFSLINNEAEELEYIIYIVEDEKTNPMPSTAIRYYYSRDVGDIEKIRGITDLQDEEGNYYLEKGNIPSKTTYNYEFCMWLGHNATDAVKGKTYSIHLEVKAIQDITPYKDLVLNGADPVLSDNLIPVKIDGQGVVTKASKYEEWYSYADREWANVVVLIDNTVEYKVGDTIPEDNIESYFVWIPKYSYKLWDLGQYTSLTSLDTTKVHAIDIKFGLTDTNDANEGECTTPGVAGSSGACQVGDYMTHPAFQAFDSNGFWVGKFESSGTNTDTYNPDALRIKPNTNSWRNITVGTAFKTVYDYMRAEESHMMKNTEWGAVAYLQHSTYGSRQSVRVNNNSSYITGYAAVSEPTCGYYSGASTSCNLLGTSTSVTLPYNTTTGYLASTTGNISGIYDMSGGSWEYVMGYTTTASSVGESSGITSIYGDFFTSIEWKKYYDKYTVNSATGFYNRILGDATGEMGGFAKVTDPDGTSRQRSSWYGDYADFAYATYPWFKRGGSLNHGVESGAFAFYSDTGGVYTHHSFRVVLTPKEVNE